MLLALDIGNTHIHLGLFKGEALVETWDVSNRRERTADEFGLLLKNLFSEKGLAGERIEGITVACVVPTVSAMVEEMGRRSFEIDPFFVEPSMVEELLPLYAEPEEVGADRIANAVGGFKKYGGPLIVVDFGTATTFDAISSKGEYLGGAIAPGIRISIEALFQKAARLPRIELKSPDKAIGRTTVDSMKSGIIFGYAGLVEKLVSHIGSELGGDVKVVATGGLAELIVRETGVVETVDQHLTLEGLRIIYGRRT